MASSTLTGWGVSVDALIPIIPVHGTSRANGLTFTGSFVTGAGIADTFTSLSGGLGSPASTPGITAVSGYNPAIDSGLVMFGTDGTLNAISWRSFILGIQYYLPGGGRFWVSANYANIYSTNIAQLGNPANVFQRGQFADGNLFWDATNAVRFGLEYAWFFQNRPNGDTATNNRVQFSAFYLF